MKLHIRYKGTPDMELDDKLIAALDAIGLEFIGAGYNFETDERDLEFDDGLPEHE